MIIVRSKLVPNTTCSSYLTIHQHCCCNIILLKEVESSFIKLPDKQIMMFLFLRSTISQFQQYFGSNAPISLYARNRRDRRAYQWLYKNLFSTFRYGMVLLYVGTLLIVIGYHNPSIIFAR